MYRKKFFPSVVELKAKLIEEFEKQVPSTQNFSVALVISEGCQSTKKWLVSTEDPHAMYFAFQQSGKTDICLWCDGACHEDEVMPSRKHKQLNNCPATSNHAEKVKLTMILLISKGYMEISTEPQYILWARMIINKLHSSRKSSPNIPIITGCTPTRTWRWPIENTVASLFVQLLSNANSIT